MERPKEIGVGIDTGKHHHLAFLKDGDGRPLSRTFLHLEDTHESVERLVQEISRAEATFGTPVPVTINMEATGPYHIPMFNALSALYRVHLWQPRQAKEISKKNIRRAKTDRRDCRTLALLHQRQEPPATRYDDPLLVGARQLVRLHYSLMDVKVSLHQRWNHELFLAFPNLDTLLNPETITAQRLLQRARTPTEFLDLPARELAQLLNNRRRRIGATAEEIRRKAEQTLRAPAHETAAAFAMGPLRDSMNFLEAQRERVDRELEAYWEQLRSTTVLASFPCMGWFRALALHAEFGGLRRFSHADAAVAFAGLENYVYQSEGKLVNGRMTKAGAPLIRRVLWELLGIPSHQIPKITDGMERMKARGKHRNATIHAAAKKVVRILWAMERDQIPYHRAAVPFI